MKTTNYLDEIIDLDEGWFQALLTVGWPNDREFVTRAFTATLAGGAGEKIARRRNAPRVVPGCSGSGFRNEMTIASCGRSINCWRSRVLEPTAPESRSFSLPCPSSAENGASAAEIVIHEAVHVCIDKNSPAVPTPLLSSSVWLGNRRRALFSQRRCWLAFSGNALPELCSVNDGRHCGPPPARMQPDSLLRSTSQLDASRSSSGAQG